jgi:hypothetical protein
MARKKENIDLQSQNIEFEIQHVKYKALRFNQSQMSIDLMCLDKSVHGLTSIAFAQLPKEIKKLIKPN